MGEQGDHDVPDTAVRKRSPADWRQLASTALVVAAILSILAVGAYLRTDDPATRTPPPAPRPAQAPVYPPPALAQGASPSGPAAGPTRAGTGTPQSAAGRTGSVRAPGPSPAPSTVPSETPPALAAVPHEVTLPAAPMSALAAEDLKARASADASRLARDGKKYTVQLLVACRPETARRALKKAGQGNRLYLLSFPERGESCYRVCWGVYATAKDARSASDLPAGLRPASGPLEVKRIDGVTR